MSLHLYVVEDMAMSRLSLINTLEKNGHKVVGSAARADVAWNEIKEVKLDLVFLDINLAGELDGLWLAKKIRHHLEIPIIFITAYGDEKTLEEVNGIKPDGYLMKPFNIPTLLTTIKIATDYFKTRKLEQQVLLEKTTSEFILLKNEEKKDKVFLADIKYIKSEGNYVKVVTRTIKYIDRLTLKSFLTERSSKYMIQVHKSYLINKNYISSYGKDYIFIDSEKIPISRTFKQFLKDKKTH